MKILFLDVYKSSPTRISKDTAGGYGTENLLGKGLFASTAQRLIKNGVFWPNLGFMHAVNEAHAQNHHVKYEKILHSDLFTIDGLQKYDFIFICSSLVCFETEIRAAEDLSLRLPLTPIALLGQISIELISKIPSQLHVIGGNYEYIFANKSTLDNLLASFSKGRIVIYKTDIAEVLNLIPIEWKLFRGGFNNKLFSKKKSYPVLVGRGCPYSCIEYCSYPVSQGRKVHFQHLKNTIDSLNKIAEEDPNGHLIFRDPVFTINRTRALELLRTMASANLPLTSTVELHLKNCDSEVIEALRAAKVTHAKFGIESSSEFIRGNSRRYSVSNDEQKKTIENLKSSGIVTDGMFILGMPSDDEQTMNDTVNYACNLGLDYAQFSIFTPYPGTSSFHKMQSDLIFDRFEQLNQFSSQFKHKKLTAELIHRTMYLAYFKFYKNKISRIIGLLK